MNQGHPDPSGEPLAKPLTGVEVLVLGGIGPVRFAAMTLADMGAHVRLVRRSEPGDTQEDHAHHILDRGTHTLIADLKDPSTVAGLLDDAPGTHVVLEGFRPGVAERLGLGPADFTARNPRIVYGRMTGWGQDGPLAESAGHDINYIALSGALEPITGADGAPVPPLNYLGDFGGGAMYLVSGVLAALFDTLRGGDGRIVDAAIVDGTAAMTAMLHSLRRSRDWSAPRGGNALDGGNPFYGLYRTADGKWMAVSALEPQFAAAVLDTLGLPSHEGTGTSPDRWPALRLALDEAFAGATQEEWTRRFAGVDACVTPVVAPDDVLRQPHLAARGTYVRTPAGIEPAPAPRFSVVAGARSPTAGAGRTEPDSPSTAARAETEPREDRRPES